MAGFVAYSGCVCWKWMDTFLQGLYDVYTNSAVDSIIPRLTEIFLNFVHKHDFTRTVKSREFFRTYKLICKSSTWSSTEKSFQFKSPIASTYSP